MPFIVLTLHLLKIKGDPLLALNRCFLELTSHSCFHLPPTPFRLRLWLSSAPTHFPFISSTAPAGMHAASALIQLWVCCLYPFLGQLPSALTRRSWDKLNSFDNTTMEGENKENWSIKAQPKFFQELLPLPQLIQISVNHFKLLKAASKFDELVGEWGFRRQWPFSQLMKW